MTRKSQPVTVTLGEAQKRFMEERIQMGRFASASEVVRAGLRALQREEEHLDEWMHAEVRKTLDNPQPGIPLDVAFSRLEARHPEVFVAEGDDD